MTKLEPLSFEEFKREILRRMPGVRLEIGPDGEEYFVGIALKPEALRKYGPSTQTARKRTPRKD